MIDKILAFVSDFFQMDGLLNQLGYMDGSQTLLMEEIVDFVWGCLESLFNDDLIRSIAYAFVEIAILVFMLSVRIYLFCVLPSRMISELIWWKKIVVMIGYYLFINFLLGTDTLVWVFVITIIIFIIPHLPSSEIDYSSEEALSLFGSMKLGGQEIAGVRTEITENGTCYYYFENGETRYLRPEYKGSSIYYDDFGHPYRKNGSSFQ